MFSQLTLVKKEVSKSSRQSTLSSSKKLGGMKLRLRRGWAVLWPNVWPYQKQANVIMGGIEDEGRSQITYGLFREILHVDI